jgi:hypothetical protein
MKAYYKNLLTLRRGLLKAGYKYDEIKRIMIEFRENSTISFRRKANIERTADDVLSLAFYWDNSPQGGEYWVKIGEKLMGVV